jgi:hypothetical protein
VIDDKNNVESNNGPYNYTLSVILDENLSFSSKKSVKNLNQLNKTGTFENIQLLSYGTYFLNLSTLEDTIPYTSEKFLIINKIKNISISSIPRTSNFKDFKISAKIFGVDDELFIYNTAYSLVHDASELFPNTSIQTTTSGKFDQTIYSKIVKNFTFSINAKYSNFSFNSESVSVEIYQSFLNLTSDLSGLVVAENFDVVYQLLDDAENKTVLKNFDKSLVNLSFSCIENSEFSKCDSFEFTGNQRVYSSNGEVRFNHIIIDQMWMFNITATPSDANIKPVTNGNFFTTTEPFFNMTISPTVIKT